MSNKKVSGILEPDEPLNFDLPLADGVVKIKVAYEPREYTREIKQLPIKSSKIFFLCSFKVL